MTASIGLGRVAQNGPMDNSGGHLRSWAMPPFDRAHTISYSTLVVTMRLSVSVSLSERPLHRDSSSESGQRHSEGRWERSVHISVGARHIISVRYRRPRHADRSRSYGIHDVALDWLRSFVTERTQQIAVGSEKSVVFPCASGAPQGSVLGPSILFDKEK